MKFSVLMSVYKNDSPEFLKRAIESVTIEQTLKPSQLVLVKDGPTPNGIDDVIDTLKNELDKLSIQFDVIPLEKNMGLAAALNVGLKYCIYDYVARMDSDDIAYPHRFEVEIQYLKEHPEVSVIGSAISEFEEDENNPIQNRIVPNEHEDIVKMLKTRNAVNHVSVIFKKADILKIGGYCENFGKLEDYKLWVDSVNDGLIIHNLSDICVNVRVGNGFIARRSDKREIKDWDMLQKYLVKIKLIGKWKAFKNKLYIRIFIYMPSWMKKFLYKSILRKKR